MSEGAAMDAEKLAHHEDRGTKTLMPNRVDALMVILISQISGAWLVVFGCVVVVFLKLATLTTGFH